MADDSLEQWRITEDLVDQIDKIRSIFAESDVAKDGQVREDQLIELFQQLDKSFSTDDVHTLFTQIDKDNSDFVDLEEFFSYVFNLDEAREVALRHRGGLHESTVYCRVRPLGVGGGDHGAGEAVDMSLDGWTEESIQVKNRHENLNFTFPKLVVTPERTQEETFEATMPQFLDAWLAKCYNVQLLAYGQSGTGKTHTMFGTRESLSSEDPHPDWGLFPRVVHHALKSAHAVYKVYTGRWALTASAVEFYLGEAYDLLGGHVKVSMDPDGSPVGLAFNRISAVSDLVPFLDTVNATRTMSRTKMNEGSSRSHCALILTLHANDQKSNELCSTSFTVMDMAGSERASKTGAAFVAPTQAAALMSSKKKISAEEQQGIEGGMINFELTLFSTEVSNATEAHQLKRRYVKPRGFATTDTMKFLGRSLDGNCLLCMIVCISQSPQHGWETWFSCTYGDKLSKLKAPLKKMKLKKMDKELKAAEGAVKKAAKELADTKKGARAKQQFLPIREATLRGAEAYVEIMKELATPL